MFVRVNVSTTMVVEVDDKYQTLIKEYCNPYNNPLIAELAEEVKEKSGISRTWDEVDPDAVGVPYITSIDDMDNEISFLAKW